MANSNSFSDTVNRYMEELRRYQAAATPAAKPAATPPPAEQAEPTEIAIPMEQFTREDWMPTAEETATGYLLVTASGGRGAIPVVGAKVTVSRSDKSICPRCMTVFTDIDGNTPVIPLPTVARELSEVPGNRRPFTVYTVQTESAGLITVINREVSIFEGITAVQRVNMLPPQEGSEPGTVTYDESPAELVPNGGAL